MSGYIDLAYLGIPVPETFGVVGEWLMTRGEVGGAGEVEGDVEWLREGGLMVDGDAGVRIAARGVGDNGWSVSVWVKGNGVVWREKGAQGIVWEMGVMQENGGKTVWVGWKKEEWNYVRSVLEYEEEDSWIALGVAIGECTVQLFVNGCCVGTSNGGGIGGLGLWEVGGEGFTGCIRRFVVCRGAVGLF